MKIEKNDKKPPMKLRIDFWEDKSDDLSSKLMHSLFFSGLSYHKTHKEPYHCLLTANIK